MTTPWVDSRARRPARQPLHLAGGFTLLEVLVALAVVAIALLAAMRAAGNVSDNAQRYRQTVLAEQCAQNFLVDQRLSKTFLSVGQSTQTCTQANVPFTVAVDVMPTPNPKGSAKANTLPWLYRSWACRIV